jgi:hypothetical protein
MEVWLKLTRPSYIQKTLFRCFTGAGVDPENTLETNKSVI